MSTDVCVCVCVCVCVHVCVCGGGVDATLRRIHPELSKGFAKKRSPYGCV